MGAYGVFEFPLISFVGVSGNITVSGAFELPVLELAGTAFIRTAAGLFDVPALIFHGNSNSQNLETSGGFTLPLLSFTGHSASNGGFDFAPLVFSGAAHLTILATGGFTLPRLITSGAALPGQQGMGAFNLGLLSLTGQAYPVPQGVGSFYIPALVFEGEAFNAVYYKTVVTNLRHSAVSNYLNFNFESFCEFPKGIFLATDSAGNLYQLYSAAGSDAGTLIDAELEFGTADFGVDTKKNCVDGFINMRGSGAAQINALVDEVRDPNSDEEAPDIYTTIGEVDGRLRNYKFKMSRKREGKNWRFSIKSFNGSYLDVAEIAFFYDILSRRV